MDDTPDGRRRSPQALESVCVEAVEAGEMTKDLAILIAKDAPYLTTEDFLDALDRRLHQPRCREPTACVGHKVE